MLRVRAVSITFTVDDFSEKFGVECGRGRKNRSSLCNVTPSRQPSVRAEGHLTAAPTEFRVALVAHNPEIAFGDQYDLMGIGRTRAGN